MKACIALALFLMSPIPGSCAPEQKGGAVAHLYCNQAAMFKAAGEHFTGRSEHEDARRASRLAAAYLQRCPHADERGTAWQ